VELAANNCAWSLLNSSEKTLFAEVIFFFTHGVCQITHEFAKSSDKKLFAKLFFFFQNGT
jgi:hypothetical protein